MAEQQDERAAARLANRFDIRRIIGGLFVLYGIILTVTGIVGSDESKTRLPGSTSTSGRVWPCSWSAC